MSWNLRVVRVEKESQEWTLGEKELTLGEKEWELGEKEGGHRYQRGRKESSKKS